MDFNGPAGLAAGKVQRFLFYPKNISVLFAEANKIQIKLVFPKNIYNSEIEKQFNSFFLHKYIDGLNDDPTLPGYAPKKEVRGENVTIYWEVKLDRNQMGTLYAIEFNCN